MYLLVLASFICGILTVALTGAFGLDADKLDLNQCNANKGLKTIMVERTKVRAYVCNDGARFEIKEK